MLCIVCYHRHFVLEINHPHLHHYPHLHHNHNHKSSSPLPSPSPSPSPSPHPHPHPITIPSPSPSPSLNPITITIPISIGPYTYTWALVRGVDDDELEAVERQLHQTMAMVLNKKKKRVLKQNQLRMLGQRFTNQTTGVFQRLLDTVAYSLSSKYDTHTHTHIFISTTTWYISPSSFYHACNVTATITITITITIVTMLISASRCFVVGKTSQASILQNELKVLNDEIARTEDLRRQVISYSPSPSPFPSPSPSPSPS